MTEELLDWIKDAYHGVCGQRAMMPEIGYYAKIAEWRDWWRGKYAPFHEHRETCAGAAPVRRELYKMGMAKKVCEDWATVLINDRTRLRVENEMISERLLGKRDCMDGYLTGGGFWGRLNAFVEQTFALGSGGVFADDAAGDVLRLHFVSPEWIVPLASEEGQITACAFLGAGDRDAAVRAVLFWRAEEKDGVTINRWRRQWIGRDESGRAYRGTCTAHRYKPFAFLTPNLVNPYAAEAAMGLGISVFASAIDNLKGVDLAYNNFCRDLYLGGKKVFMNQNLTQEDGFGNRIAPDDVAQQLFVTVGDGDLSADAMIVEHNPQLRAEENCRAVQAQLDYLSFKVGLGCRYYRFSEERVITATQYAGEKQAFLQHAMKHYIHIEEFLRELVMMACGRMTEAGGTDVFPGAVSVDFDDSFFIDPTAERERDLREVQMGLLLPWEYRMKYYGESEAAARMRLSERNV